MRNSHRVQKSRHLLLDGFAFMFTPGSPGGKANEPGEIEIITIPDKDVFYKDDIVTFDITVKGVTPSLNHTTLKATFPNETAPAGLEKISHTHYRFKTRVSQLGENVLCVTMYRLNYQSDRTDLEKSNPFPVATASLCVYVLPAEDAIRIESRDFVILRSYQSTGYVCISILPNVCADDIVLNVGDTCYTAEFLHKMEPPFEEWPVPPSPERLLLEFRLPYEAFTYSPGDVVPLEVHCLSTKTAVDTAAATCIKVEFVNAATGAPIERIYLAPEEEWDNRQSPFGVVVKATTGGGDNITAVHLNTWSKQHTRRIGPQTKGQGLSTQEDVGTVLPKPHRDRMGSTTIPLHTTPIDPDVAESPPLIFGEGFEDPVCNDTIRVPAEESGIAEIYLFATGFPFHTYYQFIGDAYIKEVNGKVLKEISTNPEDSSVWDTEKMEQTLVGKLSCSPGEKLELEAVTEPEGSQIQEWKLYKVFANGDEVPQEEWGSVFRVGEDEKKNHATFSPGEGQITYVSESPSIGQDKEFCYRAVAKCSNSVYFDMWVFKEKDLQVKVVLIEGGKIEPTKLQDENTRHYWEIGGVKYAQISSNQVIARFVDYLGKIYAQVQIKIKFDPAKDIYRVELNPDNTFFESIKDGSSTKDYLAANKEVKIGSEEKEVICWLAEHSKTKKDKKTGKDVEIDKKDYVIFFANNICYIDLSGDLTVLPTGCGFQHEWRVALVTDRLTDTTIAHEGGHAVAIELNDLTVENKMMGNIMWQNAGERGTKIQDTWNNNQFQSFRRGLKS